MNSIKRFIAGKFKTLYYFYQYLGNKLFILLACSFLMALFDGVGLTLFMPLLQVAEGVDSEQEDNGLLKIVRSIFGYFNIPLDLLSMLLLIVTIFCIKGLFTFYAQFYQSVTLQTFSKKIRTSLINGLSVLQYKEFIGTNVGRLQNSMTGESYQVAAACNQYIETIKQGMVVAVYLGLAFMLDWRFSIFVVVGGALTNSIYRAFYKRTKELSRNITKNHHRYGGIVVESVNNFKYLKASGRMPLFTKKLLDELADLIRNNISIGKINARLNAMREPMMIIIVCIVIGVQVSVFGAALSGILVVLLLFYRAMTYIMALQTAWNNYLAGIGSIENVRDYEQYLHSHADPDNGETSIERIRELKLSKINLFFGDYHVLKDITLNIKANQSIAFVGESGSGKSTLVNVLCGVLYPQSGEYLINDLKFPSLNRIDLKQKIGYISQDPTIFNADIFDNVTFWDERSSENIDKFYRVMRMCSLDRFLEGLPNGYQQLLGHNGMNVSGGQKQRISIARELYREVQILIMDEATSSLDSETEQSIKESLDMLQGKLTLIAIAHRLSTVRKADKIYFIEDGRITASGNFEELKQKSVYFRKLTDLQGM